MTWRQSGGISQSGRKNPIKRKADRHVMFEIDTAAAEYIRKRCGGAVTIVLDYQPMMGGG
jgi:guanylate kinase